MSEQGERPSVSIHAPARGATAIETDNETRGDMFQFTLPRGERHLRKIYVYADQSGFNSRSREGSDRIVWTSLHTRDCFNSRSREGSD